MRATFLALSALLFSAASHSYSIPDVEYSANWTIQTSQGAFSNKVYNAAKKERREMEQGGQKMVMISRRDKQLVWMLMPQQGMYMEMRTDEKGVPQMPMAKQDDPADLDRYEWQQTKVGSETVNGVATTKYKVKMIDKKKPGNTMDGHYWLSKDGIMIRLDATSVDEKNKNHVRIDVTDLKLGKQDQALFEVPANLQKFSMPGF